MVISSSWLVVNGDVCTIDGRRWNGRKKGPRKKRGKPTSQKSFDSQLYRIERARTLRRGGVKIGAHAE